MKDYISTHRPTPRPAHQGRGMDTESDAASPCLLAFLWVFGILAVLLIGGWLGANAIPVLERIADRHPAEFIGWFLVAAFFIGVWIASRKGKRR